MCQGDATRVLSNVELILPWNVVEACYNLERNDSTNFFATNESEATTSQISLCKLDDHSVKIQVTGKYSGTFFDITPLIYLILVLLLDLYEPKQP